MTAPVPPVPHTLPARVGIWGFGREGAAALRWINGRAPGAEVVVVDDDPARVAETAPDVEVVPFAALAGCGLVVVSPGVRPTDPRREELARAGVPSTSGTELFLRRAAERTVGVTGTKGKSTTATFVHALLQAAGRPAVLAGNIGVPLLDLLDPATDAPRKPDAAFVVELSSYQCATLQTSPRVAVVTQLYDDHLLEHGTRAAYWGAKARIFGCGAQVLVALPDTVAKLRTVAAAAVDAVPDRVDPPPLDPAPPGLAAHVAANLQVAVAGAAALLGHPVPPDVVAAVAAAYAPLPHRQVRVATHAGTTWVDDALATTQESVLAALDAHPGERVALLLGGRDRGQPVDRLVPALAARGDTVGVLLVGETAPRFARALAAAGVDARAVGTVEAGVAWLAGEPGRWDVVLLSPGAASYDQFRDHRDKGAAFAAAVEQVIAAGRPAGGGSGRPHRVAPPN